MLFKNIKITLPVKGNTTNKKSADINTFGIIKERRYPTVKSNLKSIKDYGKAFDIGRLLFTRI